MGKSVLMVVTSHDALGDTGQKTGAWLEELAASYYALADAGCEISIASPRGGSAPIDPASLEAPWFTDTGRRFLADTKAKGLLEHTVSTASVKPDRFAGVYLVGGAGTAWDFPIDTALAGIVTSLYRAGRPVAAVCHGVLGLTGALDSEGRSILAGRAATGISNAEETMVGYDKIVPVLPETRVRALGARYSAAEPLGEHVVCDGNVLTGQNPPSAAALARALAQRLTA